MSMHMMRLYGGPMDGQVLHAASGIGQLQAMDAKDETLVTYDEVRVQFLGGRPDAYQVRVFVLRGYPYTSTLAARVSADFSCPECKAGKHDNCDGTTWNDYNDAPATCPCSATHEKEKDA